MQTKLNIFFKNQEHNLLLYFQMFSCEICNHTYTRSQSLDRHNASKMHANRTKAGVNKYTCECGKFFLHPHSVRNHKLKCTFTSTTPLHVAQTPVEIKQQFEEEIKEIKQQHETEMKEIKQQHETEMKEIKQQLKETKESFDKEIRKMNVRMEKGNYAPPREVQVVREKRKKINKDVRQQIVEKQGNTCGECKLVLSAYFQIDHIIGLQFGGTDEESNLMALCCECHAIKSIAENQCRKQIKDAIQTILSEKKRNKIVGQNT